ncbi:SDR family oxidoreductase [Acidobacteriota bacterium]
MKDYYLITGGAGFIGSHLVESLLKTGKAVRVLDNLSTGRIENLTPFMKNIDFIEGDIRDREVVKTALNGVTHVLHQAVEDPMTTNEVNVTGTLNILDAARQEGVKRLVFASSSSVYGERGTGPKEETMCPQPLSPYAASKLAGEQYVLAFCRVYDLETVGIRYFNVFGPRQDPNSEYAAVIPKFVSAFQLKAPCTIYGDGEQTRDFTYIDNVVKGNLLALEHPNAPGHVFNIACGGAITVNALHDMIREIMDSDFEPNHVAPRKGDIRHSTSSIDKARSLLGYEPGIGIKEGLARTVESMTSC